MTEPPSVPAAEPLPCPFCGELLWQKVGEDPAWDGHFVAFWLHGPGDCILRGTKLTAADLPAWSRRAQPAAAPADVEALAKAMIDVANSLPWLQPTGPAERIDYVDARIAARVALSRLGGAGDGVLREALGEVEAVLSTVPSNRAQVLLGKVQAALRARPASVPDAGIWKGVEGEPHLTCPCGGIAVVVTTTPSENKPGGYPDYPLYAIHCVKCGASQQPQRKIEYARREWARFSAPDAGAERLREAPGLERAARWHDERVAELKRVYNFPSARLVAWHETSADALRALATPAAAPEGQRWDQRTGEILANQVWSGPLASDQIRATTVYRAHRLRGDPDPASIIRGMSRGAGGPAMSALCPVCRGQGWLFGIFRWHRCSICHGTGRAALAQGGGE